MKGDCVVVGDGDGDGDGECKFSADCGMQAYYIGKCTIRLRVPWP